METIVKVSSRSDRNSNIEILRFVLLCCIFIWHLIVHGLDFKNVGLKPYPYNIHLTILATAFLSPAVNCFMFISGWFGMKLRWKKVCTLSIVCILTSCICTFINRTGILNISGGGQEGTWVYLFPVSNQLWWFMTAYMMVHLVSPFIEAGLQALDKKTMLISFVGMTAIEILSLPSGANWGSTFFGLLYIYVIARYMRILDIELNARKGVAIYILALLSLILLEEFINETMNKKERLFFMLDYNNPLIITQAVCIFYIVKAIPQFNSNFINRFFAPCLCIYLIQEVIFPYKAIVDIYSQSILKGISITAIFIISSLLAGHIIFYTARKLTDFIARMAPALITKCGSHLDKTD